jgi:hypothetical protein
LRVASSVYASARISAVNELSDVLVIDQFAPISGGYSLLYFTHKPLVEVHHAFHRVNYEFFAVTAPFGGKLSQLGLQVRVETDFHCFRLRFTGRAVNAKNLPMRNPAQAKLGRGTL